MAKPLITVAEYLDALQHPLKEVLPELHQWVLATDAQLAEHIKWNSLSFYYTGELAPVDAKTYPRDLLVCNLSKPDYILLVFPTGARVADGMGILTGDHADGRRMVKLTSLADARQKQEALQAVIRQWLSGIVTR